MALNKHHRNSILAALKPEALALLGLSSLELKPGASLWEPGDSIDRIYFLETALVSLQIVTNEGSGIEIGFVGPDGAVGLNRAFGNCVAFNRAAVHIGGSAISASGRQVEQLCRTNHAFRKMLVDYADRFSFQTQQLAACNASHATDARLARWLLQRSDALGVEPIPATQEFLARIFCVRRTTITLIAHGFQKLGIIRYRRSFVRIVDRDSLEKKACECYRALYAPENAPAATLQSPPPPVSLPR